MDPFWRKGPSRGTERSRMPGWVALWSDPANGSSYVMLGSQQGSSPFPWNGSSPCSPNARAESQPRRPGARDFFWDAIRERSGSCNSMLLDASSQVPSDCSLHPLPSQKDQGPPTPHWSQPLELHQASAPKPTQSEGQH